MNSKFFTGTVLLLPLFAYTTVHAATSDSTSMLGFDVSSALATESILNNVNSSSSSNAVTLSNVSNKAPEYPSSRMFGAQLFKGAFSNTSGSTFNQSYIINPGDNIQLKMWGAFNFAGSLTADPKGNIFIPNVGPVKVAGISNSNLQSVVEENIRKVYRSNVGVYATLEAAQPIKVFVTGFVMQPGYYGGVSTDSILSYLDRAGGVDPNRGSYVDIEIKRDKRTLQIVNLYDFLLAGELEKFSFKDGDVVVVTPKKHTFSIDGEVYNPYDFEFAVPELTVGRALQVARVKPSATHVSISRRQGVEYTSEYYPIDQAQNIVLRDGDKLSVSSDRFEGTIQVRVEGAHSGAHALILPYGSTLDQVIKQIQPNRLSEVENLQLYRKTVALRQKEMLNQSLDKIEEATYSVRSATSEEASLRIKDAELIKQFIQKARNIQPKGQVVIGGDPSQVILEQDDIIIIPEKTSIIMVHGEVSFPNALTWSKGLSAQDYIKQVGGYTQSSNKSKIIIIHQNGEAVLVDDSASIREGDEIMVLPKVSTKKVEVARGISTILYQIAIAAKVVLGL